ncbi:MAG: hypothetical protein ACM3ML_26980 [Micromonosporaceae bacterium]
MVEALNRSAKTMEVTMHPELIRLATAQRIEDWHAAADMRRRVRESRSARSSRPHWWSGRHAHVTRHPATPGA